MKKSRFKRFSYNQTEAQIKPQPQPTLPSLQQPPSLQQQELELQPQELELQPQPQLELDLQSLLEKPLVPAREQQPKITLPNKDQKKFESILIDIEDDTQSVSFPLKPLSTARVLPAAASLNLPKLQTTQPNAIHKQTLANQPQTQSLLSKALQANAAHNIESLKLYQALLSGTKKQILSPQSSYDEAPVSEKPTIKPPTAQVSTIEVPALESPKIEPQSHSFLLIDEPNVANVVDDPGLWLSSKLNTPDFDMPFMLENTNSKKEYALSKNVKTTIRKKATQKNSNHNIYYQWDDPTDNKIGNDFPESSKIFDIIAEFNSFDTSLMRDFGSEQLQGNYAEEDGYSNKRKIENTLVECGGNQTRPPYEKKKPNSKNADKAKAKVKTPQAPSVKKRSRKTSKGSNAKTNANANANPAKNSSQKIADISLKSSNIVTKKNTPILNTQQQSQVGIETNDISEGFLNQDQNQNKCEIKTPSMDHNEVMNQNQSLTHNSNKRQYPDSNPNTQTQINKNTNQMPSQHQAQRNVQHRPKRQRQNQHFNKLQNSYHYQNQIQNQNQNQNKNQHFDSSKSQNPNQNRNLNSFRNPNQNQNQKYTPQYSRQNLAQNRPQNLNPSCSNNSSTNLRPNLGFNFSFGLNLDKSSNSRPTRSSAPVKIEPPPLYGFNSPRPVIQPLLAGNNNNLQNSQGKTVLCKYFVNGSCSKGSLCTFSHDTRKVPCTFFQKGTCSLGTNCKFGHFIL